MYRNTHASPYTAIVGALRRLATDAVVINASVTQVMNFGLVAVASRGSATGLGFARIERSAGISIEDIRTSGHCAPWCRSHTVRSGGNAVVIRTG